MILVYKKNKTTGGNMKVEIVKSIKDDFCEQGGPSKVTHAFLSLDSMLFELGRFYEGPNMNADTGKRLEKINEFGRAMWKNDPVENGKKFEVQAAKDGLWLHCSFGDGKHQSINLTQPNKKQLARIIQELWVKLRATRQPKK